MTATARPVSCETLVVGAGTLGLMTALRLARRGVDVLVVDRAMPMSEASGVNAGSLAAQNKLLALTPHTLAALAMWEEMQGDLGRDVGFSNPGGYLVATSRSDCELLERSSDAQIGCDELASHGRSALARVGRQGQHLDAALVELGQQPTELELCPDNWTRRPMPDRLTSLLQRFELHARVFHSGALCGVADFAEAGGLGHLRLVCSGRVGFTDRQGRRMVVAEPGAVFYPRPLAIAWMPTLSMVPRSSAPRSSSVWATRTRWYAGCQTC